MIYFINNVGNRLFCQICNSIHSSQFHFLIYRFCVYVKSSTEYIRESYDIIYLVRIIASSCWHKDVGAACHRILITDFRDRIGKSKHNRIIIHRTYHVLGEYIPFWQSYKHVCSIYSLFQRMYVCAVCSKHLLLRSQVFPILSDDSLGVKHNDVF